MKAFIFALLSGLFFGLASVPRKLGGQAMGVFNLAQTEFIVAALVVLIALMIFGSVPVFTFKGIVWGIGSGFCLALAVIFLISAFLAGLVQTSVAVTYAVTVLAGLLFAITFLGESFSIARATGMMIIIVGIIVTVTSK